MKTLLLAAVLTLAPCCHAQQADQPLEVGGPVSPPVITHQEEPKFARKGFLIRKPITGTADLYLVVDKDGLPQHVRIFKSGGDPKLDQNALEAVQKYRFKPAMKNGKPVAVELHIEVSFNVY